MQTLSPRAHAFLAAVQGKGGQFIAAEWTSTGATAAAHKGRVTKRVRAVTRTGIDYATKGVHGDRRTGGLPWGEWAIYPHIIAHKGTEYARLDEIQSMTVEYFIDGEPATLEDVRALQTPGQRKGGDAPLAVTVKLDNLVSIGGVTL